MFLILLEVFVFYMPAIRLSLREKQQWSRLGPEAGPTGGAGAGARSGNPGLGPEARPIS